VEIQSEAVDIVNLADSSSSIGKQSDFLERVKKDERMLEILLGVDCANFDILLEEVQIPYGNLTFSGKQTVHEKKKTDLIPIELVLAMTLFWLWEYPSMMLLSAIFLHHLRRMVKALKEAKRNEITWPQDEEWEELLKTYYPLLPPSLKGCITVVDGSEF
jgi:hypothetical protein